MPRAAENWLLPWLSLFSPFDQNGKLLIAEWKLWVLKNKRALLKVQVFLKARGVRRQWKKMFVLYLQFCILYNVLEGRLTRGKNHPLFLEPSEQLRFSDCGPNFTSFAGALLCS